ncbi:MAG: hypothetical protein NTX73_06610 [Rhodobacterales bacterium]|nr:hypothetical protein [Rhodobacterales bacterium]
MRAVLASLALLPTTALAEGARQAFACTATLSCDGAGLCGPSVRAVEFRLSPVELDPDGRGTVDLAHDGQSAVAWQESFMGPWVWSQDDDDLETLMLSGPDKMLWHQLTAADGGTAAVLFLTCEVTG